MILKSYLDNGWKKEVADLPEIDVKIIVSTNFGYQSQSYFHGSIYIHGRVLPYFMGNNLKDSIQHISCDPEEKDWDEMFDKLIALYESRFNSERIITDYFCQVEKSYRAIMDDLKDSEKELFKTSLSYSEKLIRIKNVVDESVFSDSNCLAKGLLMICGIMLSLYLREYKHIDEVNKDIFARFESNLIELVQYIGDKRLIIDLLKIVNEHNNPVER